MIQTRTFAALRTPRLTDGLADGLVLGLADGDAVGEADGDSLGLAVGPAVGLYVGEALGAAVGLAVAQLPLTVTPMGRGPVLENVTFSHVGLPEVDDTRHEN